MFRAGWSRRGRAAHCSPSPSLGLHTRSPAAASPWLGPEGKDKEAAGRFPWSQILPAVGTAGFKMVCGGFACSKNCLCALNLLYTVSIRARFSSPGGFAPARVLRGPSSGPLFPSSHALLRARGPAIGVRREPAAVAGSSFHCEAAGFLARWPRVPAPLLYPAPSSTAWFSSHLTRPLHFATLSIPSASRSWVPKPSGGKFGGERAASDLRTAL